MIGTYTDCLPTTVSGNVISRNIAGSMRKEQVVILVSNNYDYDKLNFSFQEHEVNKNIYKSSVT